MRFALVDDKKELRDHVAMLLGEFAAEQRGCITNSIVSQAVRIF